MNEHIGDFRILRDLRKRAGLSIAELSARCGVAASVISRLERNQSVGEVSTLYRIARVFGLTLSDLIALVEKRCADAAIENITRPGPGAEEPEGNAGFRGVHYL